MTNLKSKVALLFSFVLIVLTTALCGKWNNSQSNAVISYDVAGYYLYLPSVFYDDLGKLNKFDTIAQKYAPNGYGQNHGAFKQANGKYVMRYTSGQAIMYLPSFLVAHVSASLSSYPVDGYSFPYQFCLAWGSVLFCCIGLVVMRKLLLRFFSDTAVSIQILMLCFATNYLQYTGVQATMSHGYLFTLYAFVLLSFEYFLETQKVKYALVMGLLSGLAIITRPTEIIIVLIPLFWRVASLTDLKQRIQFVLNNKLSVLLYVLSTFAIGCIQLVYWKTYSGHWLFWSYDYPELNSFSFLHPHILDGLFSYQKGWFMYTPFMLLIVPGFYFLFKNFKSIFWFCLAFSCLFIYISFSWNCWWYGGSFSMRALVQYYVLLSFPLGALHSYIFDKKNRMIQSLCVLLYTSFVSLNLIMTYQANSSKGIMESDHMSRAYYWRIFGKINVPLAERRFLDTNEELPAALVKDLRPETETQRDTIVLNKQIQYSDTLYIPIDKTKSWYRAEANIYFPDKEWNYWKNTQMILRLTKNGIATKTKLLRLHHLYNSGTWCHVYVDIKYDDVSSDFISLYFWNAESDKQILITNRKISSGG